MKTLCVYYTRTQLTRTVMETIARNLDADLAEYTDGKKRDGFLGYVGACFASVKGSLSRVTLKGDIDPASYDRILIGMPVWAEAPCAIGRAFLKKYADRMPGDVYYVVTHMGTNDYLKKIRAMDSLLGRPSAGQFSVRTKENDYVRESEEIAGKLS